MVIDHGGADPFIDVSKKTEEICKLFYEATGLYPNQIIPAAKSSRSVFQVQANNRYYAVKEYQLRDPDILHSRYSLLVRAMEKEGLLIPNYLCVRDDSCLLPRGHQKYAFYPWLNGCTIAEHEADADTLLELADTLGRILIGLQDLPGYEYARGFHWTAADISRRIAETKMLNEATDQPEIRALFYEKTEALDALIRVGPVDSSKMTWKLTHGDYYISQVLWNTCGKISAVLDFDSIEKKPVAWELIRCFCSAVATDTGVSEIYRLLKMYLSCFLDRCALNKADIIEMPALFRQSLITTLYGYGELVQGDVTGLQSVLERHRLIRLMQALQGEAIHELAYELRDKLL